MATRLGQRILRASKLRELLDRSPGPVLTQRIPRQVPPQGVHIYTVERDTKGHYTFEAPSGSQHWQTDDEEFENFVQRKIPDLETEFWVETASDEVFRLLTRDVRPRGFSPQLCERPRARGEYEVPSMDWSKFRVDSPYDTLPRLPLEPEGRVVLVGPPDGRLGAVCAELSPRHEVSVTGRVWVFGNERLTTAPRGSGTLRYWFRTGDALECKQFGPGG